MVNYVVNIIMGYYHTTGQRFPKILEDFISIYLYVFRGIRKFVIIFLIFKNTLNLINLLSFLKYKNEIETDKN